MADTTYQPKVYNKQGGAEKVIADGGQLTVESGGEIEIESGGAISVESSGELEVLSGGKLDLQSGAEFQFYNSDFAASYLENQLLSLTTYTVIDSTGYSRGATSILSVPYGTFLLSFATGCSAGSVFFKLPAPQSGRALRFFASLVGADALIWISDNSAAVATAGQTAYITNNLSAALSSIYLSVGAQLELRYLDDTTWAVVTGNASVTEQAGA